MQLYLLNYNNKYNNLLRRETSLSGYMEYLIRVYPDDYNFKPNDGISTTITLNEDSTPDYIVCSEDGTTIHSRWFVIERVRITAGQYRFSLYRDTLADFYDEVKQATCYLTRGMLKNSDPYIFNQESLSLNQIKQREIMLKDKSKIPWIVAYMSTNKTTNDITYSPASNQVDINVDSLESWEYNKTFRNYRGAAYHAWIKNTLMGATQLCEFSWNENGGQPCIQNENAYGFYAFSIISHSTSLISKSAIFTGIYDQLLENTSGNIESNVRTWYSSDNLNAAGLIQQDGKIIKTSDNKFYRVMINYGNIEKSFNDVAMGTAPYTFVQSIVSKCSEVQGTGNNSSYTVTYDYQEIYPTFVEVAYDTYKLNLSNAAKPLNDAPWYAIAIPADDYIIKTTGAATSNITQMKSISRGLAAAFGTQGGNEVYDVQLLPYCPIPELITANNTIDISGLSSDSYVTITKNTTITGYAFYLSSSSFNSVVSLNTSDIKYIINKTTRSRKIQQMCDIWRFASPSYSNTYDFDLAKNYGLVEINIQATYKPYNPIILVSPLYNGLYGKTFDKEQRGLLLQGDFSMPRTSDAFVNYELNNRNYQDIFNRQMQSTEYQNRLARINQAVSGAVGAIQGGATAGGAATLVSGLNPAGLIAGAVGTAASGAAAIADYEILKASQNEQLSLSRDVYNMNLRNIQAVPDTLSKVGAYTIINKIFPILEYYSCTSAEELAAEEKIKYNGMACGFICTIKDYINNTYQGHKYICGTIIHIDLNGEDNHMAATIAEEIAKGVRIE